MLYKVAININLSSLMSGYMIAYFNTITFDDTMKIFNITQDRALMLGLLSFLMTLGAGFGGYLSSFFVMKYSRMYIYIYKRQCSLYIAYFAIISTLFLQTGNIYIIVLCRLMQGITIGVTSMLRVLYVKQISPIELAGKLGSINQLMFTMGLLYAFVQTYLLELFLSPEQYWRVVYFMPVLFMLIHVYNIKVNYPFQTIKYLLQHDRKSQAQQLAKVIYKDEYIE